MDSDRMDLLRKKLSLPREVFSERVKRTMAEARVSSIRDILHGIQRSTSMRAPTPRERALVDAIISPDRIGGVRSCTCIRCGINASLIATILVGFACCDSCWSYLNTIHGSLELIQLDVDLGVKPLVIPHIPTSNMDGVELV